MDQKTKFKKEKLPDKDRTGHNKNISKKIVTDTNSKPKRRKGVFGNLPEEIESDFGSHDEHIKFNGKPAIISKDNVCLFCEKLTENDLYIKHYRKGNEYFSQWIIRGKAAEKVTPAVKSSNSLDVSNKIRDNELKKLAKAKYGIDVDEHLIDTGGFVSTHINEIFPPLFSLIARSKKESQLIGIANELETKFNIVIDRLTGHLHIYDQKEGIYVPYN